jgi:N-acyl-D-amino-acid deacylase
MASRSSSIVTGWVVTGWVLGALVAARVPAADLLIRNAKVVDGTGAAAMVADVRIRGDRIAEVAPRLEPLPGEGLREARGLALAPGFIDIHSHADRGLLADPDAATQTRQGITTMVVGQDGESAYPLADWFAKLDAAPRAVNVASMVGHATVRAQVMGRGLFRPSRPDELEVMKRIVAAEMAAGAFGLSSGLEYEEAHFSTTEEVIELAKVAGAAGGSYISHVRDEGLKVFDAFDELMRIGREARLPVQITHIKLGAPDTWRLAAVRMPAYFERAAREGIDLRADVYPYTYWHSTIRVLVPDRAFFDPQKVAAGIRNNGGAENIRLARYTPDPRIAGKTIAEAAAFWGVGEVDAYMRLVRETMGELVAGGEMESIIGTSMHEDDVRWFVAHPQVAFCSDGELHGAHPRGAGTFPRILGRYVREQGALSLESAVHKMTGLTARRLGLVDRGVIAPGMVADLVLFDPATVLDNATIDRPEAPPTGILAVMNSGEWVVDAGQPTGKRPGKALRKTAMARP